MCVFWELSGCVWVCSVMVSGMTLYLRNYANCCVVCVCVCACVCVCVCVCMCVCVCHLLVAVVVNDMVCVCSTFVGVWY